MNKRQTGLLVLIAALMVVFAASAAYLLHYLTQSKVQKAKFDELAELVASIQATAPSLSPEAPNAGADAPLTPGEPQPAAGEESAGGMLPEYAPLYEMNPDLVGWISIDGTVIDYPVMQTPDRVDYYLKRNFYGESSAQGCIYIREACDVFAPSDNLTIYGHHMRDGSMFASLSTYTRRETWEKVDTIHFDTLYERHTYRIFAVFKTTASVGQGFSYHLFSDAQDEGAFQEFVAQCKALSLYDTGITPQYGDKLICLSTCDYSQTNGRLVVAAVRIS